MEGKVSRRPLHAGSWYTDSASQLNKELESWLEKAQPVHAPARAIIAPHAGYTYCGACGAHAYKQIEPAEVKRIFILGPSHHAYLPGCALSTATHYNTPLYNLKIDSEIYRELKSTGHFQEMSLSVDEEEHSIEMQLPYIAKVMEACRDTFTIVPILVGALKQSGEVKYGKLLSKYLADPNTLFVISSDFCHWGKRFRYTYYDKACGPIHASIESLDRKGMATIESLDPVAFSSYLEEFGNTICGRHPIAVLLNAVDQFRQTATGIGCELRFVQYAQSQPCKSQSDSSVSYAAASLLVGSKAS